MKKKWSGNIIIGSILLMQAVILSGNLIQWTRQNDLEKVKKILQRTGESNLNQVDRYRFTALRWAVTLEHWEIATLLLENGADPNIIGMDGGTALHMLCHYDQPNLLKKMLNRGSDPNIQNRWGRTALHAAVRRNALESLKILLENGGNPELKTKEGWTLMHVAYLSGHPEMIHYLKHRGLSNLELDRNGKTARSLYRKRPKKLMGEISNPEEYTGNFRIGDHVAFVISIKKNRLYIRDFARDELYPIGKDQFFCRREPWRVVFSRDADRRIQGISVHFIRRMVRAVKSE